MGRLNSKLLEVIHFELIKISCIFVLILDLNWELENAILPHHMYKQFLCIVFKLSIEIL